MTSDKVLSKIEELFAERGAAEYHGEAVSQQEHALQAALLAERDGAPSALIAAALLHDVGHLLHGHGEDAAKRGLDDRHEELGQRFLRRHFGTDVTEPVRLHVAAKRYLCTVDPTYANDLSPTSVRSLELQGGPMNDAERKDFETHPHWQDAVRLRRWDDQAKTPKLPTPPLEHFRKHLEAAIRHD